VWGAGCRLPPVLALPFEKNFIQFIINQFKTNLLWEDV